MRKLLLAFTAMTAAVGPAVAASNYINLDDSGAGNSVTSLAITQDATHNSNTISGDGNSPGTSLPVKGPWNSITIKQYGGGDTLSGVVTSATGSTTASINATYGSSTGGGTQGFNTHSLKIGQTAAPTNPVVTISMVNTAGTPAAGNANKVTDVIDTTGALTYSQTVNGNSNTIGNTVSGGNGAVSLTESATTNSNGVANSLTSGTGGVTYALTIDTGSTNTVSNTVKTTGAIAISQTLHGTTNSVTDSVGTTTAATSYNETLLVTGGTNTIKNTSDGSGAKTVNVTLASSGNAITNSMSGSGSQSSTIQADASSILKATVTQSGSGDTSDLILSSVKNGAGQGTVNVTQSAANTTLSLTVNGGAFNLGAGGISVTQATAGATLNATVNAGASGYTYTISQ